MIAKIKIQKITDSIISRHIKSLEKFWCHQIKKEPIIFILDSRKDIDKIRSQKTDKRLVGWFWKDRHIFILNKSKFTKESVFSESYFDNVLKHELSHFFFYQITKSSSPAWLNEGLACYLSAQNYKGAVSDEEINKLINCYYDFDRSLFKASTQLVESLITLKGRDVFIDFIKNIGVNTEINSFKQIFKRFYNINFNEKNIINILK
jgi:hypothetical protein